LLLTLIVVGRFRAQETRFPLAFFRILALALIAFTRWAFTANDLELVHYPQYLPEGAALIALTLSPAESLAWIVILGGALGVLIGMLCCAAPAATTPSRPARHLETPRHRRHSGHSHHRHPSLGLRPHAVIRGQDRHPPLVLPKADSAPPPSGFKSPRTAPTDTTPSRPLKAPS
jgi:hypothetical protein